MRNVFLIMFFAFCYNVWAINIRRAEFIPSAIAPGEPIEFVLEYRESETFYDVEIDMNTDWRPLYVRSYRYRTMSDGYKMIKILFGTDSLDYRSFNTRPFLSYLIKIFFKTRYSSQRGTYHVQASFGVRIGGHTLSYIERDQKFVFYDELYSGLPVNTFWLGTFSELGTSIKNGESLSFPLGSKIMLKGVHLSRFLRYTRSTNPNDLDYVKLKEEYILEIRTTGPFEMIKDGRKTSIVLKDKFPFVVMDKTPYTKLSDSTWNIIIYPRDIGHGYLYVSLKYRQTNEEIFSAFLRLSSFRMGNVNYSWTYQNNQSSDDYVLYEYFLESISIDINSGKIMISGNGSKNQSGGRVIIGCYQILDRPKYCSGPKSNIYTISVQMSSILYDDVDILVTKQQGGFTRYWDDCIKLAHTYNYDGYKYLNYPDCRIPEYDAYIIKPKKKLIKSFSQYGTSSTYTVGCDSLCAVTNVAVESGNYRFNYKEELEVSLIIAKIDGNFFVAHRIDGSTVAFKKLNVHYSNLSEANGDIELDHKVDIQCKENISIKELSENENKRIEFKIKVHNLRGVPVKNEDMIIKGPYTSEGILVDYPINLRHPVRTDEKGEYIFTWDLPKRDWFLNKRLPYRFRFQILTSRGYAEAVVSVSNYSIKGLVYKRNPRNPNLYQIVREAELSIQSDFRFMSKSIEDGTFDLAVEKPDSYRVYLRKIDNFSDGFRKWTKNYQNVRLTESGQIPDTLKIIIAELPNQVFQWRSAWKTRILRSFQNWNRIEKLSQAIDSIDAYLRWMVDKPITRLYDEEAVLRLMQSVYVMYQFTPRVSELVDSALAKYFDSQDALLLFPLELLTAFLPNFIEKQAELLAKTSNRQIIQNSAKILHQLLNLWRNLLNKAIEEASSVSRMYQSEINGIQNLIRLLETTGRHMEISLERSRFIEYMKRQIRIHERHYKFMAPGFSPRFRLYEYVDILKIALRDANRRYENIQIIIKSYQRSSALIEDIMRYFYGLAYENLSPTSFRSMVTSSANVLRQLISPVKNAYNSIKNMMQNVYQNRIMMDLEILFEQMVENVKFARRYGFPKYQGAYDEDIKASMNMLRLATSDIDRVHNTMHHYRFWGKFITQDVVEPIVSAAGAIATLASAGAAAPMATLIDLSVKAINRYALIAADVAALQAVVFYVPQISVYAQEAMQNAFGRYSAALVEQVSLQREFWKLRIFSPVEALAADTLGLMVGRGARGERYLGLPGAAFWEDDSLGAKILRLDPSQGPMQVMFYGSGTGPYRIELLRVDSTGQETLMRSWQGLASPQMRARLLLDPVRPEAAALEPEPPARALVLYDTLEIGAQARLRLLQPRLWRVQLRYQGQALYPPHQGRVQVEQPEIASALLRGDSLLIEPRRPGRTRLIIEADGLRRTVELFVHGMFLTGTLERERYQPGETLRFFGELLTDGGQTVANAPVQLQLQVADSVRTWTVRTDAQGRWQLSWTLSASTPTGSGYIRARYGPLADSTWTEVVRFFSVLRSESEPVVRGELRLQNRPVAQLQVSRDALSGLAPRLELSRADTVRIFLFLQPSYRILGPLVAYNLVDAASIERPELRDRIKVRLYVAGADSAIRGTRRILFWPQRLFTTPEEIGPDYARASWAEVSLGAREGFLLLVERNTATTVAQETSPEVPERLELAPAYPNPFRDVTTIRFGLPRAERVWLELYDLLGRRVCVLLDGELRSAGWHSVQLRAQELASGVYLYRLRTEKEALPAGKLILVR